MGESQSHPGASAVSSVVGFVGSTTWGVVRDWSHGHLRGWRGGVPGPTAAAAQLPVSTGATVVGRLELYVLPPCHYWVLWGCRLSCCGQRAGIAGTTSTVPPVLPFLCVLVQPPLDVQICGLLWRPSVLGRGALLHCGYLPGCRLKGRDQSEVSFCHVADISLQT